MMICLPAPDYTTLGPADSNIVSDNNEPNIIDFVRMRGCVMFLCETKIQNITCVISARQCFQHSRSHVAAPVNTHLTIIMVLKVG